MTDLHALLAAVIAQPTDDLPRLIYADYLEDHADAAGLARAAFIRAQIGLAQSTEWEPLAILARHADRDTTLGRAFWPELPWSKSWYSEVPYHRGFGYSVACPSLPALLDVDEQLFASAPVGDLILPAGTIDDWNTIGECAWLSRVEQIRFAGLTTPVEAVRMLCRTPHATRLKTLRFDACTSPGLPLLVEAITQAPIGRHLSEVAFRIGTNFPDELIEALDNTGAPPPLKRLSFQGMNFNGSSLFRLSESKLLTTLEQLIIRDNRFSETDLNQLLQVAPFENLRSLTLENTQLPYHADDADAEAEGFLSYLADSKSLQQLRYLKLSRSFCTHESQVRRFANSTHFPNLCCLNLSNTNMTHEGTLELLSANIWPQLLELDLSDNALSDDTAREFCRVAVPPRLVRIVLNSSRISQPVADMLRTHFGDALILKDRDFS